MPVLQKGWISCDYILLYVDDMLIAFETAGLVKQLYEALVREFEGVTVQEGSVISFLGVTISQSESEITLDQQGYIKKMIESLQLESIPVYKNPLGSTYKITRDRFLKSRDEADKSRLDLMRSLSMTLMYIALRTRKDVLFLSSFFASINCPEEEDIAAVKRAMVYTYNSIHKKQHFYREGDIEITLMGDASHNLFSNARGQGCQIIYGDQFSAPINMTSNCFKFVTSSSYHAELVVQADQCDDARWYWLRLEEILYPTRRPIPMYCDNEAAVKSAQQEHICKSAKTKYYNLRLFKTFEFVRDNWVASLWLTTKEMNADIGTKPLTGHQYHYLADRTFSRLPNFVEPLITDLDSIVVYEDANEPYLDYVQPIYDEDEDSEMRV